MTDNPLKDVENAAELLHVLRMQDGRILIIVALSSEMPDPGLWGIILVDAAHHIADAMVRHGVTYVTPNGPQEMTARDALDRIRELFDKEWEHRTDTVEHVEFD